MQDIVQILVQNLMNERLDRIALQDEGYCRAERELAEWLKRYEELLLSEKDAERIGHIFESYVSQSARYAEVAYRQGMKDSVQLLTEIGLLKTESRKKEAL